MRPSFRIVSILLKGPFSFKRWAYPTFTVITVAVAPRTVQKNILSFYGMSFLFIPFYLPSYIIYATHFICKTFKLQFKQATSIVVWANPSLYNTFAGPAMQKGNFWKIHLE